MKKRNRPIQGFAFNTMINLLTFLKERRSASDVYAQKHLKFKKSVLRYMKWCLDKKYIEKIEDYKARGRRRNRDHPLRVPLKKPYVDYKITKKGRQFLIMLC